MRARSLPLVLCPAALLIAMSCGGGGSEKAARREAGTMNTLALTSAAFKEGATVPAKYTCDGADLSPPLSWSRPPAGTKALALICEDPDAPRGLWVHWVLWGLKGDATSLPEGVPKEKSTPGGAHQGRNDFGMIGYGGPCPPQGPAHRYFFKLYALDAAPQVAEGATRADLLKAIEGHVLAQGELMGRYAR